MRRGRAARNREWLGLTEASALLGVSATTIRRWSDAGQLNVFTTPGGHRRFSRSVLERLVSTDRPHRPTLSTAGVTPARLARTYRRRASQLAVDAPWLLRLTDAQRELFRSHGRILAASLLRYLDEEDRSSRERLLEDASAEAAEYGRVAASLGFSLSQTVEGFLRFRAPFLGELAAVARRRGFETSATTDLLAGAERGLDRLLLAAMTGHAAFTRRRARPSAQLPAPDARSRAADGVAAPLPAHGVAGPSPAHRVRQPSPGDGDG